MPINPMSRALRFNSLVLIPSDHCNIKCRHCYPECGPTEKLSWDVASLKRYISEGLEVNGLHKSVHFAGGEPFLYLNSMLEVTEHAHRLGYDVSVVTNGFWGNNQTRAEMIIGQLVRAGLVRVELSVDRFHQEFIPVSSVRIALKVLRQNNIQVVLRVVVTRKHRLSETLDHLTGTDLANVEIAASPMVPMGRALEAVNSEEYYLRESGAWGSCADLLNLTIRPDGNVSPCCAGSDLIPCLSLGNAKQESLKTMVEAANWNLLILQLVHSGPASFFDVIQRSGLGRKIAPRYTNICHACTSLMGDPNIANALRRTLNKKQAEILGQEAVDGVRPLTEAT